VYYLLPTTFTAWRLKRRAVSAAKKRDYEAVLFACQVRGQCRAIRLQPLVPPPPAKPAHNRWRFFVHQLVSQKLYHVLQKRALRCFFVAADLSAPAYRFACIALRIRVNPDVLAAKEQNYSIAFLARATDKPPKTHF